MNNTNKAFSFFDEIRCINLDTRPEKWIDVQKEFSKLKIYPKRFSGIKIEGKSGGYGCSVSHAEIVRQAHEQKLNNVLIFEDDVVFQNNINEILPNCTTYLENHPWELFYLGCNLERSGIKACPCMIRLFGVYSNHAWAINHTMFDRLINDFDPDIDIIDVYIDRLIVNKDIIAYAAFPLLANQKPGFSDLEGCFQDYSYIIGSKYNQFN